MVAVELAIGNINFKNEVDCYDRHPFSGSSGL